MLIFNRGGLNLKRALKILTLSTMVLIFIGAAKSPALGSKPPLTYPPADLNLQSLQQQSSLTLKPEGAYWRGYLDDTAYILTAPTRWQSEEWFKASLVAGTTILLYLNDEKIRESAQTNRNNLSNEIADLFEKGGRLRYVLPSLGLLYLYGSVNEDQKALQSGLYGLESLVITCGLTYTIKMLCHRRQPGDGGLGVWGGPGLSTDDAHLSFPSGHSAIAFSTAGMIAAVYGEDNWLVAALAYGIAGLTAWSRVNDDQHWVSDVFFGSAVGYFTAKAVAGRRLNQGQNWPLLPSWSGDGVTINYIRRF